MPQFVFKSKLNFARSLGLLLALGLDVVGGAGCRSRLDRSAPTATPEDRKVIGAAVPYKLGTHVDPEYIKSLRGRRKIAWAITEELLHRVSIGAAEGLPGFAPNEEPTLPIWQTWHDSGEFVELFKRLYGDLGRDGRMAKRRFCNSKIKEALDSHAKKSVKGWTPERLEQRLGQLKDTAQIQGVSGKGLTLFSPGFMGHLLGNYNELAGCSGKEATFVRGLAPPSAQVLSHCMRTEFPRAVDVSAEDVPEDNTAGNCVGQDTLDDLGMAVAIKSTWHAVGSTGIGDFDTNAEAIPKIFDRGEWIPDRIVDAAALTDDKIFTIKLVPSGRMYRLVGIHMVVKALQHWYWISLWWSNNPTSDFGEDRPRSFDYMGPWANYKMCAVTDYVETDTSPWRTLRGFTSLSAAIEAYSKAAGSDTWCSNPFIEQGHGNSRTNCIGCHQHAGSGEDTTDVYLDDPADPANVARREKYPGSGRRKVRANFPSDYLWSINNSPDTFALKIKGKAFERDQDDKVVSPAVIQP